MLQTSVYQPINELSHIHEKYCDIKKLLSEDNPSIRKECNAVEENIFETNKSIVDQNLKSGDKALDKLKDNSVINGSQETKTQNIGAKRRQLKERALSCKTNITNGRITQKIERKYDSIKQNENRNVSKGKRGRPKVAKLNAVL